MRKLNLFLLLIFIVPSVYFSSCAKDDDDDNDRPVILYAHMNVNDTLYRGDDNKILLNDSTKADTHEIDTVVIGKYLSINAAFRDKGKGLSSFKVETNLRYKYNGEIPENSPVDKYKDSILEIVKLGRSIYGRDSVSVAQNRLTQIPDSITRNYQGGLITLKLVAEDYPLKVVCMDIGGNRDSITFPVRYLHRKTIYDAKDK